jgi:hypothetical protein
MRLRERLALSGRVMVSLALCGLLVGCGVSAQGGSGAAGGATPAAGATVVVNGTPIPSQRLPTPSSSPIPGGSGSTATATPGAVRLVLDKVTYAPGDPVAITIENGLSVKIVVSDHHTGCTSVQLEKLVLGSWQPAGGVCKLLTPVRLITLAPGSVTPQRIGIPTGASAVGTYRVKLVYGAGGASQGGVALSANFSVG